MSRAASNTPARAVEEAGKRLREKQYALFPEWGSSAGLEDYDAELSANDPGTHTKLIRLFEETLAEVEAIPASACSGDTWLDRRLLLAQMRISLLKWRDMEKWRINPQIHVDSAISSIFDLILRDPENLTRYAPAIVSRLKKIPKFLEAGAACVRNPVPLWTKLACQTCEGTAVFLSELEAAFPEREKHAPLFQGARKAFERFAKAIQSRKPGPENAFSLGRPAFEFMIRENLGLDLSTPEAERLGLYLVEKLQAEIRAEAKKLGGKPEQLLEKAENAWQPQAGSLLEEYRRVTTEMQNRFLEKELMTFPEKDKLNVLPVPAFMRHQFPTAAYHAPGPFARRQQGVFWVNDLSLIADSPEDKRREILQHYGMELTCAHEAYPGHHLQFVMQNRHPSHIRRTAHHPIYYEGWTLWCEKMCVDHSIYKEPLARLMQLRDALWRACRIVIDCRLHTGQGGFNGACKFLRETVGFTAARARNDVNWYTSSPTVPMSYLLGRLEVESLHEMLVLKQGWTVRRFNDWILSFGAIPWAWIRRRLWDG